VGFRYRRHREGHTSAMGVNEIPFMRVLCVFFFTIFITLNLLHVPRFFTVLKTWKCLCPRMIMSTAVTAHAVTRILLCTGSTFGKHKLRMSENWDTYRKKAAS
jgi:hypothetical protein